MVKKKKKKKHGHNGNHGISTLHNEPALSPENVIYQGQHTYLYDNFEEREDNLENTHENYHEHLNKILYAEETITKSHNYTTDQGLTRRVIFEMTYGEICTDLNYMDSYLFSHWKDKLTETYPNDYKQIHQCIREARNTLHSHIHQRTIQRKINIFKEFLRKIREYKRTRQSLLPLSQQMSHSLECIRHDRPITENYRSKHITTRTEFSTNQTITPKETSGGYNVCLQENTTITNSMQRISLTNHLISNLKPPPTDNSPNQTTSTNENADENTTSLKNRVKTMNNKNNHTDHVPSPNTTTNEMGGRNSPRSITYLNSINPYRVEPHMDPTLVMSTTGIQMPESNALIQTPYNIHPKRTKNLTEQHQHRRIKSTTIIQKFARGYVIRKKFRGIHDIQTCRQQICVRPPNYLKFLSHTIQQRIKRKRFLLNTILIDLHFKHKYDSMIPTVKKQQTINNNNTFTKNLTLIKSHPPNPTKFLLYWRIHQIRRRKFKLHCVKLQQIINMTGSLCNMNNFKKHCPYYHQHNANSYISTTTSTTNTNHPTVHLLYQNSTTSLQETIKQQRISPPTNTNSIIPSKTKPSSSAIKSWEILTKSYRDSYKLI